MSGTIFISYRRSDSHAEAGRIYDKLASVLGPERLFKDVDSIPCGVDFVEHLARAVAQCNVLIALIGHDWLTATDAQGNRRLDDVHDFVRIEIASALKRHDILVVPILLNGASMPAPEDLPADLKSLARRNAVPIRQDPDFHRDMQRFITDLDTYFTDQNLPTIRPVAALAPLKPSQLDLQRSIPPQNGVATRTKGKICPGTGLAVTAGIALVTLVGVISGGFQIPFEQDSTSAKSTLATPSTPAKPADSLLLAPPQTATPAKSEVSRPSDTSRSSKTNLSRPSNSSAARRDSGESRPRR